MAECDRHDSQLVRKSSAAGRWMYTFQCRTCGQIDYSKTGRGPWVPKPADVDLESVPEWDHEKHTASVDAASQAAAEARAQQCEAWWIRYDTYMASDAWRAKRRKALERDRWLCQGCLEHAAEHVHHLTYERFGNELLCDLVSLCSDCHQRCHPHRDLKGIELHGRPVAVH